MRYSVKHFDLAEHAANNATSWVLSQNPSDHKSFINYHRGLDTISRPLKDDGVTTISEAVQMLSSMWGFVMYDDEVDSFLWTDLEECRSDKDPFLVSLDKAFESASSDKPNNHLLKRSSGITILTLLRDDVRSFEPIMLVVKKPMYNKYSGLIHEIVESGCPKLISCIVPAVSVYASSK
jgi:hypothetical protein